MTSLAFQISHLSPCSDARKYLDTQTTWEEAWNNCKRADWLLWLIGKDQSIKRERIVLCACAIARTVLQFLPEKEDRPRIAIETAEKWSQGLASLEQVHTARTAAYAAYAAAAAADAAYAAADAAAYAAAYAARVKARSEHAKIVRQFFPEVPNVFKKELT